ncbi:MAG: ABC transporter [Xanthomonadales bacterium]|nr:Gldg family protein [Gammaproteobacteria bacterium]MBT8056271.1 Gldg family protein [Gammaproteobacteria bacterium]NNL06044.1 ABC transporter [Xanthomonadales bacterium]
MKKQSYVSLGSLVLLLILFIALNMISGNLLKGFRLDLTENRLFTLSEGTVNILQDLEEPVTLYFYFSQDASREIPAVRAYAKRVNELLDEFVDRSSGLLSIKRIDPKPFSEEEDQAAAFGLQAAPINTAGDTLYFGIAGSNSLDDVQVMPFLQPSKEKFLEYDLAKMVSSLGQPERKVLGILSTLRMSGGYDPAAGMTEPWVVYQQLEQLFELRTVDASAGEVPPEVDVLMLVHPRDLAQDMLYAIEQFVLRGGGLVAFVDPFAESDRGDPNDPMAQMQMGSSSSLGSLLDAWGIDYDPSRVVGDLQFGIGNGAQRHIGILSVPADGMNDENIVSADLEVVNFSSAGWLKPDENAQTTFEVLVESSENAAPMDASRLRFLANPNDLLDGFKPSGERYPLAVRVTGPARASMPAPVEAAVEHRDASVEAGINVLLMADSDLLTDRMWVQVQPLFGATAFADNGNLAINAVDNMLGNRDLISIRTRATSARPFDRVEEIRVAAERSFRQTEERLQRELEETERRLTELQAAKGEGDLTVISDEQQEEIQRFMDRRLEIRRELRQVQHDLRRDIDRLDTRIKVVNIVLVPALVMVMALAYAMRRRRRQRQPQSMEAEA